LWCALFFGWIVPFGDQTPLLWHGHEMIFGFAPAIVAGFLLTAVRNWTGLATPTGGRLALLVVLWLLGRIGMFGASPVVTAVADLLFIPALAVAIGLPIVRSRNGRNYKVVAVLAGLALCNVLFHGTNLGVLAPGFARTAIVAGIDLIMVLLAVVGGRVIPAFTNNAVAEAEARHDQRVEIVAFSTLVAILGVDLAGTQIVPVWVWMGLLMLAALAHAIRLALWQPLKTRRQALLWMMPVAYAWIPVALVLRGLADAGWGISASAGIHAFTIGAMLGLMLAMMMRSALGHGGRALVAGRADVLVFLLVQAAAVIRVFVVMVWPEAQRSAVVGSSLLWAVALGIFAIRYWPILTRPRVDGKPG
jgi:uncharacterized protein involved in response to NO